MAPRETENNAYAKFWGVKQGALWYVMVFSGVVNGVLRPFHYRLQIIRDDWGRVRPWNVYLNV